LNLTPKTFEKTHQKKTLFIFPLKNLQ